LLNYCFNLAGIKGEPSGSGSGKRSKRVGGIESKEKAEWRAGSVNSSPTQGVYQIGHPEWAKDHIVRHQSDRDPKHTSRILIQNSRLSAQSLR
jgi:hypothetical protein